MAVCLCNDNCSGGEEYELRVKRYFPRVKDFERDAKGDLIWASLKGPERIEVCSAAAILCCCFLRAPCLFRF